MTKKRWIIGLGIVVVCLFGFGLYIASGAYVQTKITSQVNHALTNTEHRIAINQRTRRFLKHHPDATHLRNLSDAQAATGTTEYYVGAIAGRNVDIYVHHAGILRWQVTRMALQTK